RPAAGAGSGSVQPGRPAGVGKDRGAGLQRTRAAAGGFEGRTPDLAAGRFDAGRVFASRVMTTIDESYAYCRSVARGKAKNFYYSFLLLSRQQRKAMCAIYAFMRHSDDLSDEAGASWAALESWRAELED